MSRQIIPLATSDLSAFARQLGVQLDRNAAPGHLELLNMLARAAGFRNFQHLRAATVAKQRLDTPEPTSDQTLVERALRHFDDQGVMRDWPARRSLQTLCLWALWSQLSCGACLHERDLNTALKAAHSFGDPALLRRDMVGLGLLARNISGTAYSRCERPPPPEARDLIRRVTARRKTAERPRKTAQDRARPREHRVKTQQDRIAPRHKKRAERPDRCPPAPFAPWAEGGRIFAENSSLHKSTPLSPPSALDSTRHRCSPVTKPSQTTGIPPA